MSDKLAGAILDEILASIEIPDKAFERAAKRYKDLGEWFGSPEANCSQFDPHIYPQGSFRLGTVVRSDEYDLDFGCRLRKDISKYSHSQKNLKDLVRSDMETYRKARGIESPLEEKNRCWRLQYADELSFHMDAVPSIPEETERRQIIEASMVKMGAAEGLARNVANLAGAITDKTLPHYSTVNPHWPISNSEGYALWFESRIEAGLSDFEKRAIVEAKAQVDDIPIRAGTTPLQQVVKLLKAHRDQMFAEDGDSKPISVIITTLAALAYAGERDVTTALQNILQTMGNYVRPSQPRVPNPVNPVEDFADKWHLPAYKHLNLEEKFWRWLEQAQLDFAQMAGARDAHFIGELVEAKLAAKVNIDLLATKFGAAAVVTAPKSYTIAETPKPWRSQ